VNYTIKQNVIDSLARYIEHGIEPGGFLEAVLANDLMESFGRADMENRESLFDICSYIYNELPSNSHGSYDIFNQWIKSKRAV
jgi:hypothetical protein